MLSGRAALSTPARSAPTHHFSVAALVGFLVLFLTVTLCFAHEPAASQSSASEVSQRAGALTQALTTTAAALLNSASPMQRQSLEQTLLSTATARHQLLLSLMETSPGTVLGVALSSSARSKLPRQIGVYLEEEVDIEGVLEIHHEDWPSGGRFRYSMLSAGSRYSLHFATAEPTYLLTGDRVRVRGVRLETRLALGPGKTSIQTVTPALLPNTLGEQRTLVMLVNFADNPTQPYTLDVARTAIFGAASDFIFENSYQHTWLSGDIVGWFTIALSTNVCDDTTLASQAKAAAIAAGVDLAGYARYIYAFPANACGWAGLATVGGTPSEAWIKGNLVVRVIAHELGHGLGLWHSHSLDCGSASTGSVCSTIEYGDVVDTMGGPIGFAPAAHYNAFQKERLGWLNSSGLPPITTVNTDGAYTLEAYESPGTAAKALKIPRGVDAATGQPSWYYVEFRRPLGSDGFLAQFDTNVLDGVLIHSGSPSNGNSSHLINMTPTTDSWWDPALLVGQTFSDPATGVTITADSIAADGAIVTVRLAEALTVSTDQSTYTRGQSVSLTASVKWGNAPAHNTSVSFTITKSNGTTVAATVTTGSNGTATYQLRLRKQDPIGLYRASAVAAGAGAATDFTVR